MKTGFSPLPVLETERTTGTAGEDTTDGKQSAPGGFDAMLAAVAAQVATLGVANRAAAPTPSTPQTSVPTGDAAKDLTRAHGNTTSSQRTDNSVWLSPAQSIHLAGVGSGSPTARAVIPFAQVLTGEGATAGSDGALTASPGELAVPADPLDAAAPQGGPQAVRGQQTGTNVAGEVVVEQAQTQLSGSAQGKAARPADGAPSALAKPASNGAAQQGNPANLQPGLAAGPDRTGDPAVDATRADDERTDSGRPGTADAPAPEALVQPQQAQTEARLIAPSLASLALPVQGAPTVMNAETASSKSSAGASRSRAVPASVGSTEHRDDVAAAGFGFMASDDTRVDAQGVGFALPAAKASAAGENNLVEGSAAGAVEQAVPLAASSSGSVGAAAQPRVSQQQLAVPDNVKVEFVELAPVESVGEPQAEGELSPRDIAGELDASAEHAEREPSGGEPGADAQQQRFSDPRAAQPFQGAEVQGARGLEQVVASLLRASSDTSRGASPDSVRNAQPGPTLGRGSRGPLVVTAKSSSERATQQLGQANQQLSEAEARREDELIARRELGEHEPLALVGHGDSKQLLAEPAHEPAPLLAPPPSAVLPDADAAMMGKLQRGEGVNAANISIDHPELGALDLVVRSENGRVDVRATAETPKAAAVLRAHESALRYGIQQAGMNFGALRVRSRAGDGEGPVSKVREVTKQRRRNHEWEA